MIIKKSSKNKSQKYDKNKIAKIKMKKKKYLYLEDVI